MRATTLLLVAFSVGMSVTAQLSLRQGMGALADQSGLALARQALGSAWVLGGIALYALSTVSWLQILRRVDLVVAYPLGSLSYVLVAICSALWLREELPLLRWSGVFLILLGVLVVARGERRAPMEGDA